MSASSEQNPVVSKSSPWVPIKGKLGLWFKAYLNDTNPATFMNKTHSARVAGYNCKDTSSFGNVGCQNYNKLRDRIELWMDDHGLTPENNKKKLLQLSEAEETRIITVDGQVDPDSLAENFTIVTVTVQDRFGKDGGVIKEYKTVLAYKLMANETQRRTVDMMIKVKGQYATEKIDVTLDNELVKLMRLGRKRAQEAADD